MSGGVDSSVAAYLMREAGFDCIGVTMRLFDDNGATPCEKSCCSLEETEDARSVARRLGIPYYVFNFTGDFRREVIGRFIDAYERGETPNPCVDCNRCLKFGKLFWRADELSCGFIATGHYARVGRQGDRHLLLKGTDPGKDQSYVLYGMTQEQLSRVIFPLGEMTKDDVRALARSLGFSSALKRDSQDICFVPDGDYAAAIERYTGREYPRGRFVDREGRTLGEHRGIIHYTIGQRKGLGLALPEPLYVLCKDVTSNEVVLGRDDQLYSSSLDAAGFNWIACGPADRLRAGVKIRYRQKEQPATIFSLGGGRVHIEFDSPVRAVSPGQAAVAYDGDVVIGGGVIA